MDTLQGINISHLGKRKIIFKMPFLGDMLVPWRVMQSLVLTNWPMQIWRPQTMKACGNQKLCRHLLRLFQFLPLGLISLRTLPAIVWTPSDCEGDGTRPQTCGKNQSWHSVARANWTSSGRCCRPHDAHAPAKSGKLWNTESGTLPFFSFSNLNVSSVWICLTSGIVPRCYRSPGPLSLSRICAVATDHLSDIHLTFIQTLILSLTGNMRHQNCADLQCWCPVWEARRNIHSVAASSVRAKHLSGKTWRKATAWRRKISAQQAPLSGASKCLEISTAESTENIQSLNRAFGVQGQLGSNAHTKCCRFCRPGHTVLEQIAISGGNVTRTEMVFSLVHVLSTSEWFKANAKKLSSLSIA